MTDVEEKNGYRIWEEIDLGLAKGEIDKEIKNGQIFQKKDNKNNRENVTGLDAIIKIIEKCWVQKNTGPYQENPEIIIFPKFNFINIMIFFVLPCYTNQSLHYE